MFDTSQYGSSFKVEISPYFVKDRNGVNGGDLF